ncbi:MAG: FecR domain-containing protein [Bacteroidetes bacterium]|nr:FecR domain-containing protein [Bacteroidota bacterium]
MIEEYHINLIYKYLSEECSPEEKLELETWRDASPLHLKRFKEEQQVWDLSGKAIADEATLSIDLEADFAKLQQRIKADRLDTPKEPEEPTTAKLINLEKKEDHREDAPSKKWNYGLIAASMVVLIGLSFFLRYSLGADELIELRSGEQQKSITLADGSKVLLNANSLLKYPEEFGPDDRQIWLEGEAYFEVSPDANRPFSIETKLELIKVIGTSFNVLALGDADEASVFVVEGLVEFSSAKGKRMRLAANEKGQFNRSNGGMLKLINQKANDLAWFKKELHFEDAALQEVLTALEKLHAAQITYSQEALANCRFSGSFKEQDLASSLEVLALIYNFEIEQQGEVYQLKNIMCK